MTPPVERPSRLSRDALVRYAYLELAPGDAATIRVALFDVALEAQLAAAKRLAARLRGEEP